MLVLYTGYSGTQSHFAAELYTLQKVSYPMGQILHIKIGLLNIIMYGACEKP